jgi:hypothetical protein
MDNSRIYFKQYEQLLNELCRIISDKYEADEKKPWVLLYNQRKAKQLARITIVDTNDYEEAKLPEALSFAFKQIDVMDSMAFRAGMDPDSTSFKYFNSLQEFKFTHQAEIQLNNKLAKLSSPLKLADWNKLLKEIHFDHSKMAMMFDTDYQIGKILVNETN